MPTTVRQQDSYEMTTQPQSSLAEMEAATGTTPPRGRHTTTLLQAMQANRPTWLFMATFSLIVLGTVSLIRCLYCSILAVFLSI